MCISGDIKELKLDVVHESGHVLSTRSIEYYVIGKPSKDVRYNLYMGDHVYSFTENGELIKQLQ